MLEDYARIADIETVVIGKDTNAAELRRSLEA
jgi:L-arabinose isomerase